MPEASTEGGLRRSLEKLSFLVSRERSKDPFFAKRVQFLAGTHLFCAKRVLNGLGWSLRDSGSTLRGGSEGTRSTRTHQAALLTE